MIGSNCREYIAYVPLVSISNGMEQSKEEKRWKWPSTVITFWIISALLVGLVYFIGFFQLNSIISFSKLTDMAKFPELTQKYNSLNGYLINTPGCRIPDMDPNDPSVTEFIFKPGEIICNKGVPPLFDSNFTSFFIKTQNLLFYNLNITDLKCCYDEFWRQEPTELQRDNVITHGNQHCFPLNFSAIHVNVEYVKVTCNNSEDKKVYEDYFTFVPLKKKIEFSTSSHKKPNILVLGLDAVSRVNLQRQLPNTYEYITKELGGIELLGYNKVADNTFPNLIPVLTGMAQNELESLCWPTTASRFDRCPFLWEKFSKNNYVTAFGEDCAYIGLFNYQKKGFFKQPTDYYYTSFSREIEDRIGSYKDFNCLQCVGGRKTYELILDYIRKFVLKMKLESIPYFGFFWSSALSHDYLNRPALGDQPYYDLLSYLKENGYLQNTILIFMSDHGIRWGGIRRTYQGQMEERLPFLITVLPKWFKENYPIAVKNFNKNTRKLTTPFDLHETLKDLLDLRDFKNDTLVGRERSRGYSLFTEIPIDRKCEDAGIDSHWCTCQQSIEIVTNDAQVVAAAKFAVSNINQQLDGYAQCATLVLDSILSARVLYHDSEHITDKKSVKDYTVVLKTMPGEAVFEVTVRYKENIHEMLTTKNRKRSTVDEVDQWTNFTITGTISRLNLYGRQSYCITDFHLKLYCYCTSLLNT